MKQNNVKFYINYTSLLYSILLCTNNCWLCSWRSTSTVLFKTMLTWKRPTWRSTRSRQPTYVCCNNQCVDSLRWDAHSPWNWNREARQPKHRKCVDIKMGLACRDYKEKRRRMAHVCELSCAELGNEIHLFFTLSPRRATRRFRRHHRSQPWPRDYISWSYCQTVWRLIDSINHTRRFEKIIKMPFGLFNEP